MIIQECFQKLRISFANIENPKIIALFRHSTALSIYFLVYIVGDNLILRSLTTRDIIWLRGIDICMVVHLLLKVIN